MKPYYEQGGITIYLGDCREVMAALPEGSVDAVVCDPPYELSFMNSKWDSSGVAFRPETWADVLRVAKPGAHLLAFGGTRTYHRLVCAIEDAGWEIRDCLMWIYGQGFPKSLDVSKAIDKAAGAEREVVAYGPSHDGALGRMNDDSWCPREGPTPITAPATEAARQWAGFGTSLKPAWEPIVLARKPLDGTVAANVLKHGTGALNIDGCRVGTEIVGWGGARGGSDDPTQSKGRNYRLGAGKARPVEGRWPTNLVMLHHPDCRPCGTRRVKGNNFDVYGRPPRTSGTVYGEHQHSEFRGHADADGMEAVAAWECHESCPVRALDEQSGERKSGSAMKGHEAPSKMYNGGWGRVPGTVYGDSGGASRYFPQFSWCEEDIKTLKEVALIGSSPIMTGEGGQPCPEERVPGDTSTSDRVVIIASGESPGVEKSTPRSKAAGYGNRPTDPSPTDMRSTIETRTRPTTTSPTSNASLPSGTTITTNGSERITGSSMEPCTEGVRNAGSTKNSESSTSEEREPIRDTARNASEPRCENGSERTAKEPVNCAAPHIIVASKTKPDPDPRFFPTFAWEADDFAPFLYCPKASRRDRGPDNTHPTVKPQALMRWLCRLVCPPGAVILDPFMGSGTTLRAALDSGCRAIGIDTEESYCAIAARRLEQGVLDFGDPEPAPAPLIR